MRTRLIGSLAIATLTFAACGGGSGGQQGEVADMMLEAAGDEGFDLDEDCVRETADKLSDDDAAKIVEAGPDGNADLSEEADALANEMFSCVNTDALVDQMVDQLGGEGIDTDCLKDVLSDMDPEALADGDMPDGLFECIEING
jgi:hypothetical protein